MIRNIIHTLGSRLITSIFSLILLLITTQWMGATQKGAVSLLVLNLSLTAIFSGLFGGPSLVYLIPRLPIRHLLFLNYSWSLIAASTLAAVIYLQWLPGSSNPSTYFLLGLLECLIAAHLMMLLGKELIKMHNWITILKTGLVILILCIAQFKGEILNYHWFEHAYMVSLFATYLASGIALLRNRALFANLEASIKTTALQSLRYGFLVQVGNIAQMLNYRISFYFLELMTSPPALALARIGIYSAALQIAEALWQFAKSISTVQYAAVSNLNLDEQDRGLQLSLSLGKLNYGVTFIGITFLCLLPGGVYTWLLGADFAEVKTHLLVLSFGIVALSLSNALSHYFAGVGQHHYNTYSSWFGLFFSLVLGYFAIKHLGTIGAAATASITYVLQTLFQMVILQRNHALQWRAFLINSEDLKQLLKLRK